MPGSWWADTQLTPWRLRFLWSEFSHCPCHLTLRLPDLRAARREDKAKLMKVESSAPWTEVSTWLLSILPYCSECFISFHEAVLLVTSRLAASPVGLPAFLPGFLGALLNWQPNSHFPGRCSWHACTVYLNFVWSSYVYWIWNQLSQFVQVPKWRFVVMSTSIRDGRFTSWLRKANGTTGKGCL